MTWNLSRAAEFYQKACDGELLDACRHLGKRFETGAGVTQDDAPLLSSGNDLYARMK